MRSIKLNKLWFVLVVSLQSLYAELIFSCPEPTEIQSPPPTSCTSKQSLDTNTMFVLNHPSYTDIRVYIPDSQHEIDYSCDDAIEIVKNASYASLFVLWYNTYFNFEPNNLCSYRSISHSDAWIEIRFPILP